MAKEYAYYIEGNKVAIVEKDTAFNNNINSKEYGPGVSRAVWKSPQSSITDGLEVKYAYSPKYRINQAATTVACDRYTNSNGLLKIVDAGNGGSVTEAFTVYTDVDVLNDEADEIDLPSYLQKALVYYVKARVAEDMGEIELKEYNMREYKKHIETYESTLMKGPRMISSGFHAIR